MSRAATEHQPKMRRLALGSALVLLALAFSSALAARTFTHIGAGNGLEARVAVSLLIDRHGLLWVGSREGLFRYDGYHAQAFLPEPGNPASISDTDIRYVFESADGVIWAGTNTGGLNRYDPARGTFTVYRHDSNDPASLLDDSIYGIAEGPQGDIWVATQQGLSRLHRDSGRFEHYVHDPADAGSLSHNWVYNLRLGDSGRLWVSTVGGGVNLWVPETQSFEHFDLAALTGGPAARNDAFPMHEGGDGRLWVGTRQGLVVLDPETGRAEYVPLGKPESEIGVITAIAADGQGRLWLGTMVHGVLILDTETGESSPANPDPLGAAGNLPAQPQMSLAIGPEQLFVGTWGSGVYRLPLLEFGFRLLNKENSGGALRNNTITTVMATGEPGQPWVGSFGGGPQRVDVWAGEVTSAEVDGAIAASGVIDLARDAGGQLFAATTEGLFRVAEDGSALGLDAHDPGDPDGIGEGYVYALLPAAGGDMWVGLAGSGLHFRSGASGEYRVYRHDADAPDSLSGNFITTLLDDTEGYIWVGTRSNGLNRCRIEPWSCERFSGRSSEANELSHFHVTSLYRDRRGRLWVATDGGGLNRVMQDSTGRVTGFEHWGSDEGLLNDSIMAVAEDVDESLWLSTRHGLSRINTATRQVVNFVSASGLPVSHYNTNSADADDGYIYFGSVDGLLSFRKGSLLEEREAAPVRITGVRQAVHGRPSRVYRAEGEGVEFAYGDGIALEFAVLDYSESVHEYAYRLHGGDGWTEIGRQDQIFFHDLAPGRYEFQVRGRDIYGLWGQSRPLPITIVPPFWMTTWFRVLVVVLLLLTAVLLHLSRQARLQRRADEIQRLSETRERALEEFLGGEAELAVLTPRQKEILQLIAEGKSTRDIAETLFISVKTVEAHRANLMDRLGIRDVPGLVRLAVRARLVSPHD